MAAGVRDLSNNLALRMILRREYAPFDRPPAAPDPTTADEDLAAAAARLQRARIIDAALAQAILSGDIGQIVSVGGLPRGFPPRGTGNYVTFAGDSLQFGTNNTVYSEVLNFPYLIEQIALSAATPAAGAVQGKVLVELWTSGRGPSADNARPATGTKVWPLAPGLANEANVLISQAGQSTSIVLPVRQPVTTVGQRLAVFIDPDDATVDVSFAVLLQEIDLGQAGIGGEILRISDLGKRYVGGSVPPPPREPGRHRPVGFTFRVVSGGKTLTSRTVPYSASAAASAGYNPVTGAANPNVVVHTSEASWSAAFERERQGLPA